MPGSGEGFVLLLIILILLAWLYFRIRSWTSMLPKRKLPFLSEAAPMTEELAELLARHGYEGIGGKLRIPLSVIVDGKALPSRLFVDGFARKDDSLYVIRLERQRQPMEWTGPGVRDRLLPYALLYDQASGILYINEQAQTVTEIRFDFHPNEEEE